MGTSERMLLTYRICLMLALSLASKIHPSDYALCESQTTLANDPIPTSKYLENELNGVFVELFNLTHLLTDRFPYLFKSAPEFKPSAPSENSHSTLITDHDDDQWDVRRVVEVLLGQNVTNDAQYPTLDLEDRRIIASSGNYYGTAPHLAGRASSAGQLTPRYYFRVLDKVFSRTVLPEVYRSGKTKGTHCGPYIGCIEELPNFPALLKKPNVSSSYTIYTQNSTRMGHKIQFEPLTHYQLQDVHTNETELEEKLRLYEEQAKKKSLARSQSKPARQTAKSWRSAAKIVHSQEYPFDMSAIERSGFNASLNTRVIIGGYFAKEDEEWIDEVVRQWLLLEPHSNVIKVSWAEANRGLYHSASYNSRIVGRQLSLFLHYLDQMFHIDLAKFHLVGHSLGAHIAGFVGADCDGRIARITGLDPAGPIFVELNTSLRLDASDARFVDVMHTNGGTITKGSLGLSTPVGHVDYYCNGGSIQPGCYFSSVTKSIMDPVERIACNHRRSYRYFIDIIKLTIRNMSPLSVDADSVAGPLPGDEHYVPMTHRYAYTADQCAPGQCVHHEAGKSLLAHLPSAFLFEAKPEELARLVQPDIVIMRRNSSFAERADIQAPVKRRIEFHLLNPEYPVGARGMYFFRTRSESPFFGEYPLLSPVFTHA